MSAGARVVEREPRAADAAARPRAPGVGRIAPLGGLLVIVALNWLLWASAVPFGEAPDEPSHLEVAQFVAAHGRLPRFGPDADLYVRLDQVGIPIESHALAPPLPYLVDALLIRVLPMDAVVAARLGSLLAALVAVALTYRLVLALAPWGRWLGLAAAALVAAVPETSFLAAAVNSDVFALATGLGVACLWPLAIHPAGALPFGIAIGLALLAKYTVYPVVALALLAAGWRASGGGRRWRGAVVLAALVAGGALGVAGPWLGYNWLLYGAPWPVGVSEVAFRALSPPLAVAGAPGSQQLWSAEYWMSWGEITFRSFWAGFGRVDVFAPGWAYVGVMGALAIALAGLARVASGRAGRARLVACRMRAEGAFLVAWPAAVGLAVFGASLGRYYPAHGRYLMPALPPVALGLLLGWRAAAPWRWRWQAPWALVAGMAALNLYCVFGVVVPRYYGPAATRVVVTVDEPRPGDLVAGSVRVRGWAVVSGRATWEPGRVGGSPAWHASASEVRAAVDDGRGAALRGGAAVRPDVARALGAPGAAAAGFEYLWEARGAAAGVHVVEVCAADPAAPDATCVAIPVLVRHDAGS